MCNTFPKIITNIIVPSIFFVIVSARMVWPQKITIAVTPLAESTASPNSQILLPPPTQKKKTGKSLPGPPASFTQRSPYVGSTPRRSCSDTRLLEGFLEGAM